MVKMLQRKYAMTSREEDRPEKKSPDEVNSSGDGQGRLEL
jgi:hypothetical protein